MRWDKISLAITLIACMMRVTSSSLAMGFCLRSVLAYHWSWFVIWLNRRCWVLSLWQKLWRAIGGSELIRAALVLQWFELIRELSALTCHDMSALGKNLFAGKSSSSPDNNCTHSDGRRQNQGWILLGVNLETWKDIITFCHVVLSIYFTEDSNEMVGKWWRGGEKMLIKDMVWR